MACVVSNGFATVIVTACSNLLKTEALMETVRSGIRRFDVHLTPYFVTIRILSVSGFIETLSVTLATSVRGKGDAVNIYQV